MTVKNREGYDPRNVNNVTTLLWSFMRIIPTPLCHHQPQLDYANFDKADVVIEVDYPYISKRHKQQKVQFCFCSTSRHLEEAQPYLNVKKRPYWSALT